MNSTMSILPLALALVGMVCVCLVLLICNRRWRELAIVLLAGGALALFFQHGRRGPDRFNGTDNGTTRLEPPAESEPHAEPAENAEPKPHAETAEGAKEPAP